MLVLRNTKSYLLVELISFQIPKIKKVSGSFLLEMVRTPQTRISGLAGHSPFPLCALYSSEAVWGLEGGGPSGAICRLINVRGLINAVVGARVLQSTTKPYCGVQSNTA